MGKSTAHEKYGMVYSRYECLMYNMVFWNTAFTIGVNFSHIDFGIMREFVLDWKIMKNWPLSLWLVFFGLVTVILTVMRLLFNIYIEFGILDLYIAWFAC